MSNHSRLPIVPMDQLLRAHLAHLRRRNVRAATFRDRRDNLLRFLVWLDGVSLMDVTQDHIERWQDSLRARGLAASSQVTYVSHIKAAFTWAYEYDHLDQNPAARIVLPRQDARLPRPVPLDDFRVALRSATGDLVAMIVLAGYLGLRSGEVARLTREDVLRERRGAFLTVHGKGGKVRTVPLPAELLDLLSPWLLGRGPVFFTPSGRQATPRYVSESISEHFHNLAMPYTAHRLRHRAATRLLELTSDVRLVQQFLGHASLNTTAGYTQVADGRALSSVQLLSAELAEDLGRPRPPQPPEQDGPALQVVA